MLVIAESCWTCCKSNVNIVVYCACCDSEWRFMLKLPLSATYECAECSQRTITDLVVGVTELLLTPSRNTGGSADAARCSSIALVFVRMPATVSVAIT